MSQFNQPVRRGGSPDVYTGILFIAFIVLLGGVAFMALRNMDHVKAGGGEGPIGLVEAR